MVKSLKKKKNRIESKRKKERERESEKEKERKKEKFCLLGFFFVILYTPHINTYTLHQLSSWCRESLLILNLDSFM